MSDKRARKKRGYM